jgi:2-polyprenyl-6-methoxyphenol hydroxylase-like FAD-dependent oxidoreductase
MNDTSSVRGHAVVIGASIAGLLAARALSASFDRVTVFDRDALPDSAAPRRGVPQSRQIHALLARGADGLEKLFPGFLDDMALAGADKADAQADFAWYLDGHRMAGAPSDLTGWGVSRPLIEKLIRDRVVAGKNVSVVSDAEVTGLVVSGMHATGVRVRREPAGDGAAAITETVPADLVVDAAGRGSRCLNWLGELGFPLPEESSVAADVVYVTRHFHQQPGLLDGRQGATVVPFPGHSRMGAVIRQENGQFAFVLAGMLGEEPPTDHAGMVDFASSLAGPEPAEVLRSATPADEPVKMRYPASRLRHFDKLDSYLGGYLVTGDALCSFNPIYGQGMTVAVLEAELLQSLLQEGAADLPRRFFTAAGELLVAPWSLAAGGDLRFPEVEGPRGPQDEEIDRYLTAFRAAAAVDPVLGAAFLHVAHMVAPAESLFAPELTERVQKALAPTTD